MFTFFTELTKQDVVDRHGRWVGRPYDFTAKLDEPYPPLTSLIVASGKVRCRYFIIPWENLHHAGGQFQLKTNLESLTSVSSYREKTEITLRKNILDQQVVDTYNRKIVRVNDIHLLQIDNSLRLAHVDVGARGLARRLGWEKLIDIFVRLVNRHARYLTSEKFISWKFVQPLSIQPQTGKIRLNVDHKELVSIPPADLSEMLMELDTHNRAALFMTLDSANQIDILTELELKWQVDLIEELDPRVTRDLLERMPADEATDLLGVLPRREREQFIQMLSPKKARAVHELLQYEKHSAGGLMTTEYIDLKENITVREALDHIFKIELKKAETIYNGYVVDDDFKLIGTVSLRGLLKANPETPISEVMQTKPPALHLEDSLEEVATIFSKYNFFTAPVIDDDGTFEGIITVDDVLEVMIEEEWGVKA
ncbi:MAG: CBS domain-containing protein [Pseudomonadota bacterium]